MKPHEVIKEMINKEVGRLRISDKETKLLSAVKENIKSSQLSLLLSVKEMCEQYKNYYNPMGDERNKGKHEAMSDLQSLLDAEINKVKEL